MRTVAITTAILIIVAIGGIAWLHHTPKGKRFKSIHLDKRHATSPVDNTINLKLSSKAKDAKAFTLKNRYNSSYCFLIDMSRPSNQRRFFIYDLKKDSIINAGLVTHGRCNQEWLEGRKYGNEVGCGCTSLGKYRIGHSYSGRFGLAFKLHGLDKTNDKAFERFVVLHAHDCVPEAEVRSEICQSDGCPTVSSQFLQQLKPMIKNSEKPVLLWIYE